ncbi:hypothetical protein LXL04_028891 [Taraxacum kok-saghyz]
MVSIDSRLKCDTIVLLRSRLISLSRSLLTYVVTQTQETLMESTKEIMEATETQTQTQESLDSKRKEEDISNAICKERKYHVEKYVCRWAIESAIPFNAFETDSFKTMLEAVKTFESGVEPPK